MQTPGSNKMDSACDTMKCFRPRKEGKKKSGKWLK